MKIKFLDIQLYRASTLCALHAYGVFSILAIFYEIYLRQKFPIFPLSFRY